MFTDTERLNWVINRQPTFDTEDGKTFMIFFVPEDGCHVAYGKTHRECIDNALTGNSKRID